MRVGFQFLFFELGSKWIKKGGLCARGWENREPFFIDLLWGKQVLMAVGKTTCAEGSVGLGGRKDFSGSVPILFRVGAAGRGYFT